MISRDSHWPSGACLREFQRRNLIDLADAPSSGTQSLCEIHANFFDEFITLHYLTLHDKSTVSEPFCKYRRRSQIYKASIEYKAGIPEAAQSSSCGSFHWVPDTCGLNYCPTGHAVSFMGFIANGLHGAAARPRLGKRPPSIGVRGSKNQESVLGTPSQSTGCGIFLLSLHFLRRTLPSHRSSVHANSIRRFSFALEQRGKSSSFFLPTLTKSMHETRMEVASLNCPLRANGMNDRTRSTQSCFPRRYIQCKALVARLAHFKPVSRKWIHLCLQ